MERTKGRPERHILPPELQSVLLPALQTGGISGMSGLLFGGVAGILRSSTPTLFAIASGIQWFTLGSTYCAARGIILERRDRDVVEPLDMIAASSVAGGIAGFAGGLLRGPRNVVPGALVFAMLGGVGQAVYNIVDARRDANSSSSVRPVTMHRWMDSKWSPIKVLSDDEYDRMLREKLLRVEAEIALIDESIMDLHRNATKNIAPQPKHRS